MKRRPSRKPSTTNGRNTSRVTPAIFLIFPTRIFFSCPNVLAHFENFVIMMSIGDLGLYHPKMRLCQLFIKWDDVSQNVNKKSANKSIKWEYNVQKNYCHFHRHLWYFRKQGLKLSLGYVVVHYVYLVLHIFT